jgi:RimJ/RimL family protein N-acetyltransferase
MAGDVNLFFHDCENRGSAEINVMIAETDSRRYVARGVADVCWSANTFTPHKRKGLAKEALSIMMYYAVKHLKATQFVAKISDKNSASLNLFRSHFQFREEGHSDFFEETTLLQEVDEEFASKLANWTAGVVQNDNGFTPLL